MATLRSRRSAQKVRTSCCIKNCNFKWVLRFAAAATSSLFFLFLGSWKGDFLANPFSLHFFEKTKSITQWVKLAIFNVKRYLQEIGKSILTETGNGIFSANFKSNSRVNSHLILMLLSKIAFLCPFKMEVVKCVCLFPWHYH